MKELRIQNNRLESLPESIGNLHNLTNLFLSNNRLNKLPDNFCNLSNLETLNLSGNKLIEYGEYFKNIYDKLIDFSPCIGIPNHISKKYPPKIPEPKFPFLEETVYNLDQTSRKASNIDSSTVDETNMERRMEEKYKRVYSERLERFVYVLKSWIAKPVFKRHKNLFGYTDIGWTVKHPKRLIKALVEEGVWVFDTNIEINE